MKLSIVIPVYNEEATISKIVDLVRSVDVGMEKEILLVDDCSRDGTRDVLQKMAASQADLKVLFHEVNQARARHCARDFPPRRGTSC